MLYFILYLFVTLQHLPSCFVVHWCCFWEAETIFRLRSILLSSLTVRLLKCWTCVVRDCCCCRWDVRLLCGCRSLDEPLSTSAFLPHPQPWVSVTLYMPMLYDRRLAVYQIESVHRSGNRKA